ncbi:PIN domain-containing protein [Halosolutus amylolyticus]|uniref:PIN domain-containing protein n=1 Tax=Halosolutus amylolyticus TaxID=2932267 RepID=A0ABD5PKW4_9EURY|nr:PIN domain-containing protein [Halosolutus amylolyticus]
MDGVGPPTLHGQICVVGASPGDVRASLERLEEVGVTAYDPKECWERGAVLKEAHGMALDGAYALATAAAVDGTLLVGTDDDFDRVEESVERFRNEPA